MAVIDVSQSAHYTGDCRELLQQLPDGCIQTCVTSPPYWGLRDYGVEGQLGLEQSPHEYVANMVAVFREVRRVLRDDGTLWLNLGDSYASGEVGRRDGFDVGHNRPTTKLPPIDNESRRSNKSRFRFNSGLKPKDLVGIPWMVAFALREDGWYLRSDVIWAKPNPMPESVQDRPTKAHEYVFLLSKSGRYYYDAEAISEPAVFGDGNSHFDCGKTLVNQGGPSRTGHGPRVDDGKRNKRTVWTIASQPYDGAHFATMPPALAEPCILAGSHVGDLVLDPFFGSGTTGMVAEKHGRKWIGFDINPKYAELQKERTAQRSLLTVMR